MHVNREQLLNSFKSLQNQFDSSLAEAKKQSHDFEVLRQKFMQRLSSHLTDARKNLPAESPVKPQVLGFIDVMEGTKIEWDKKVAGQEKGLKFRENFEDSLLVFINGKVKSGKSSLGNYIAWGHTDPDEKLKNQIDQHLIPIYFSHENNDVDGGDAKNEAELHSEFRVAATEATSSIQGFKLPGLTWVDSPGLHSVKNENEKLARDYVEHADLILYTMKSDAPGRESDLQEIPQLLKKGKTVLLLLTGSDDIEEDYDDEADCIVKTLVMKDVQRRERQRTYVREALEQTCGAGIMGNVEIISFSAHYAQLNADNSVTFSESGMGQLCETLYLIAQSNGVSLKQHTPIANMRIFLQSCLDGLKPYSKLISGFKQPLDNLKKQSNNKLNTHIRSGQAELNLYINEFFSQLYSQRDEESLVSRQLENFQQSLTEKYKQVSSNKLGLIFEDIMIGFRSAVVEVYNGSELDKLAEFKLEKIEEKIPMIYSGTKKRNSVWGTLLGGTIGFMVGGPAGAAVGASVGGTLGSATGSSAEVEYHKISVTIGDNLQEICQQVIRSSEKSFEAKLRSSADTLWASIDKDVEELLEKLRHEIADFESQLERMLKKSTVIA